MKTNQTEEPILIIICRNARQNNAATVLSLLKETVSFTENEMIATEKTIFDIFKFILDHIWLRGFGGIREIIISFLSIPQASQPRMNFNISELVNQYFFGCGQPNAKGALSLLLVAHQRYAGFVPWKVRGFFCTLAQVHEFNLTTKLLLLFRNVFFWGGGGMSGILRIGFASALHCKKLDHSTETQAREVGLWQFFSVVSDFRAN